MSSRGPAQVLADEAYGLVQVDPRRARATAERALAAATAQRDASAQVAALHALSWAQFQLGDPRAGVTARSGIRVAKRNGDRRGMGLLLRRLAFSHALAGETRAAQRELEQAIALLDGDDRAQSEVFRLAIHRRADAADPDVNREVLARAARALRLLRRTGDEAWQARLLRNRGMLLADRGELAAADADFRRALALYTKLGAVAAMLETASSIADLERLQGDLVACLATLDSVQATLTPGQTSYNLSFARANAFADARLLPEARAAANAYIEQLVQGGLEDEAARARLNLARVVLASGDPAAAASLSAQAARTFAARGAPVHAAIARTVRARAQILGGSVQRATLRSNIADASLLEHAGWRRDGLRARLVAVRAALALGSTATARRQLELARPLRRLGSVADRTELSYTDALVRLSAGDRAGAQRQLAGGLRLLDDYRAALGALELRATASGIGSDLAELGLRLALESAEPRAVLAWSERLRGNALRLPLVRPAADGKLRRLQADLRLVADELRSAEATGKASPSLFARQRELEGAIRARTLSLRGERRAPGGAARPAEAAAALGDRALVEYVALDGALFALTLVDGRLKLHDLGPGDSATELEWLRFALARLARGRSDRGQRTAAKTNAETAAASLDRLLVKPLRSELGDAPIVVAPTGALHAMPWAMLPSLRGRPIEVAPSLSTWLDVARRPHSRRRKSAFVAGPRLRNARVEASEVSSLRAEATVLEGKHATVSAALAAFDGAGLAHVACHGHFRADSPLFSSLELADGPLNVYELQGLRRAPELVVLSACDLAVSTLHPGDELLGFATALLGMGTRTIVASVVPVPDAAGRRVMLAFHEGLAAGHRPAAALATAQKEAAVAGFVCLGAG